jgi:hypothetical protein
VLEELFVEPFINMLGDNVGYGILIKLFIVLLLKLSEGLIERKITRRKLVTAKEASEKVLVNTILQQ